MYYKTIIPFHHSHSTLKKKKPKALTLLGTPLTQPSVRPYLIPETVFRNPTVGNAASHMAGLSP